MFAGTLAAAFAMGAPQSGTLRTDDVVDHLEKTMAWYRHVQTADQSSMELVDRQALRQSSLQALRLAFDFARATAGLVTADAPAPQSSSGNFQQAAARANDRVTAIQNRLNENEAALARSGGRQRENLLAQRQALQAELDLAKQIQNTLQTLVNFSGSLGASGAAGASLTAQIDELERSVPEARHDRRAAAQPSQAPAPQNTAERRVFRPESSGIIGLITDLFTIQSSRAGLTDLRKETDALAANIDRLRAPLLQQTRASLQRADELANEVLSEKPEELAGSRKELADLSARFKQVSAALVPLSEQNIAVGNTRGYLVEAINDRNDELKRTGRYLLLRAVLVAFTIFVILLISQLWRRATFRYVSDARRRRQFLTLRKVVVACAITIALVLGFVTEFGSLATYAGFVTAGLAVALQSPILSVVAYFFLIGRYGIRVGDRVTISGVTGEVIEIGLVRIYLMELGPDLHPTGRVVVFANSIIFQPSAWYKQMPGIDYVWHTVTLTLAPDSDFQLAEAKLNAAVDAAFANDREKLERQYRAIEKTFDVRVAAPHPESQLRFSDSGVQYTVRYPADLKQAAATDDRVMKALYDAIENESKLKFAPAGAPKVQLAA